MTIRELRLEDMPTLEQWHAESGFDYPFPGLYEQPHLFCAWLQRLSRWLIRLANRIAPGEFARVAVVVDEDGAPVLTVAARKTVEGFLMRDPNWGTPRRRLMSLQMAHEDMRRWLREHGYPSAEVALPPEVERAFGRRLEGIFGWTPGRWKRYSRSTRDER